MAAGMSSKRTSVASSARAIPKPISWKATSWPLAKPAKTTMMIAAAPVIRRAAWGLPRWLELLGYALAPILVVGAASFVVNSGALSAALALSLVLLLAWVATVTVTRRGHAMNA
jgi:hypothetical protein